MELLKQGAEAKLFRTTFMGKHAIVKQRFQKKYRHPSLDEKLTHKRTLQEARAMLKCRKAGIRTPVIYFVNYETHEIYMEEILKSKTLRDEISELLALPTDDNKEALQLIAQHVGKILAKMHSADVIHGDLTTSNMLITKSEEEDVFTLIDFGLSFTSYFAEDKGVDLYVLERAFLSTHPDTEWLFQVILDTYMKNSDKKKIGEIMSKLEEVRMRGRKRVMIG